MYKTIKDKGNNFEKAHSTLKDKNYKELV